MFPPSSRLKTNPTIYIYHSDRKATSIVLSKPSVSTSMISFLMWQKTNVTSYSQKDKTVKSQKKILKKFQLKLEINVFL